MTKTVPQGAIWREGNMKSKVIALIALSGYGKTELIKAVSGMSIGVVEVSSFTTRPREPRDKDGTYEFITCEELDRRLAAGLVVQHDKYGENFYGNVQSQFDAIGTNIGILAMTEPGARALIALGYDVRIVKVVAVGATVREGRPKADEGRVDHLQADVTITNSFAPGGLNRAILDLVAFITTAF